MKKLSLSLLALLLIIMLHICANQLATDMMVFIIINFMFVFTYLGYAKLIFKL